VRLIQRYTGRSPYFPDYLVGDHRLLVAVVCVIAEFPNPVHALLDTGSSWCVLDREVAAVLGCSGEPAEEWISTRFGTLGGRLYRLPLLFVPRDGDEVRIEATWFVSDDWPGPAVIGWKGGLERIRHALDPTRDHFYFASDDDSPHEAP
jgi:hypothetical protein